MADFQNFAVTPKPAATINTQTHEISAQVTDSGDGHVIADYTGQNALQWPACLNLLTPDQQQQIAQDNAQTVILMLAGLQQ